MTRGSGLSKERLEPRPRRPGRPRRARRRARPGHRWSAGAARSTSTRIGTTAVGGSTPVARDTIFRISSMTKPVTAVAAHDPGRGVPAAPRRPGRRACCPSSPTGGCCTRLDGPLDDTVPAEPPDHRARPADLPPRAGASSMAPPGTYPIQAALRRWRRQRAARPGVDARRPTSGSAASATLPLMHQPGASVDVQHRLRRARRAHRPRRRAAVRDVPARAHLRAARHEGHRLQRARRQARPPRHRLLDRPRHRRARRWPTTRPAGSGAAPPAFPSGGGGLVSTVDDYLAFAQMLLAGGRHGGERILSRPSVELMTTDQLTRRAEGRPRLHARATGTTTAGASAWPS